MPPGFSTRPKCNPINPGKLQDPNSPSLTWVLPIMNWLNSFQAFHEPPNTTRVPRSPGPPLLAAPFTGFRFGPGKTGQAKWQVFFRNSMGPGVLRIATDITHIINVWVIVDLPTLGWFCSECAGQTYIPYMDPIGCLDDGGVRKSSIRRPWLFQR